LMSQTFKSTILSFTMPLSVFMEALRDVCAQTLTPPSEPSVRSGISRPLETRVARSSSKLDLFVERSPSTTVSSPAGMRRRHSHFVGSGVNSERRRRTGQQFAGGTSLARGLSDTRPVLDGARNCSGVCISASIAPSHFLKLGSQRPHSPQSGSCSTTPTLTCGMDWGASLPLPSGTLSIVLFLTRYSKIPGTAGRTEHWPPSWPIGGGAFV
jgi:hypothetical protein